MLFVNVIKYAHTRQSNVHVFVGIKLDMWPVTRSFIAYFGTVYFYTQQGEKWALLLIVFNVRIDEFWSFQFININYIEYSD